MTVGKGRGLLVAVAIVCTLATGCGRVRTLGGARAKDELVLAVGGEPADGGFDPTRGWGHEGSPLFQSTLLVRDDDSSVVCDLATGYTVSDDGLTYTVKLRPARFSDGTTLTADDVAFTYEATAKGGAVDLSMLRDAEALDASTVRFTLKRPSSIFVCRMTRLGIVPRASYGPHYADRPVGSGPYRMVRWEKGRRLVVEANPYYYGPKPAFKGITFLFLSEEEAFAAAKAGVVDVAAIPSSAAMQKVDGMNLMTVRTADSRGIGFPMLPATGRKTADGHPIGNDVTSDRAVRQAVNYAVDRHGLVAHLLSGFGAPAYSSCDGLPWGDPDVVIEDSDAARAERMLADAGWKDTDSDGVLEKGTVEARFDLLYLSDDPLCRALSLAVAETMKPIGVSIRVSGKSSDGIVPLMHSNAVMWDWGSQDPCEADAIYDSRRAGRDWDNAGFYSNPVVDGHLEAALEATCEAAAIPEWRAAAWDGETGYTAKGDAAYAWLVNVDHVYLVADGLDIGRQRIHPHGHGFPVTANITEWMWTGL